MTKTFGKKEKKNEIEQKLRFRSATVYLKIWHRRAPRQLLEGWIAIALNLLKHIQEACEFTW